MQLTKSVNPRDFVQLRSERLVALLRLIPPKSKGDRVSGVWAGFLPMRKAEVCGTFGACVDDVAISQPGTNNNLIADAVQWLAEDESLIPQGIAEPFVPPFPRNRRALWGLCWKLFEGPGQCTLPIHLFAPP